MPDRMKHHRENCPKCRLVQEVGDKIINLALHFKTEHQNNCENCNNSKPEILKIRYKVSMDHIPRDKPDSIDRNIALVEQIKRVIICHQDEIGEKRLEDATDSELKYLLNRSFHDIGIEIKDKDNSLFGYCPSCYIGEIRYPDHIKEKRDEQNGYYETFIGQDLELIRKHFGI